VQKIEVAWPISHTPGAELSFDQVAITGAIACRKLARPCLRSSPTDLVQERRNVGG
jgi:hypothetical protein